MTEYTISLLNVKHTIKLGYDLAFEIKQNNVIFYLYGDIGVGKTTLVRGFLQGLGYYGIVKSPSYTLIESYLLPDYSIYHFDLYRLTNIMELEFIGIRDFYLSNSIWFIEWPQNGDGMLPMPDLKIYLSYNNKNKGRNIKCLSLTKKGNDILQKSFVN